MNFNLISRWKGFCSVSMNILLTCSILLYKMVQSEPYFGECIKNLWQITIPLQFRILAKLDEMDNGWGDVF